MCGLAWFTDPSLTSEARLQIAQRVARALQHRGPDAVGIKTEGAWAMAHTRLAIIDLAGSLQPMSSADGRYWLAYNGEIYNYRELRASLVARWQFRTQGDTEVLFAGLLLEGPRFLSQANGMWAFALWDSVERKLIIGRDRLGKKPMYYRHDGSAFGCASELPALRVLLPGLPWKEDLDSTADYLRYGFALPGFTAYQDTFEVLPGHWLEWSSETGTRQHRYWTPGESPALKDSLTLEQTVRELLDDSVRLRLVADVDVGCFLSGGVDSSLVSSLAARRIGHRLNTFSIGFVESSYDESQYAERMAATLNARHTARVVEVDDIERLARLLHGQVGVPFADPSLLPVAVLSELAANHVKVALSGDGGDELFAGYQRYLGRTLLRWYTRLPMRVRRGGESLLRTLPEPTLHHSGSLLKKAHLFAEMATQNEGEVMSYVAPRLFSDPQLRRLAAGLSGRGHVPPGLPERCRADEIQHMMTADALNYLPQDILVKTDRAAMAHSLEVRCPFLDFRLADVALTAGTRAHLRISGGKRLLRRACGDLIPGWVWRRRKQGFAVPTGSWFRGALGHSLQQSVQGSDSVLADSAVSQLLDEHRSGARDHGLRLWALWSYQQWRTQPGLSSPRPST